MIDRFVLTGLILAAGASGAAAQQAPDMVGTWTARANVVHIGPNPYRVAQESGPNFPNNIIDFTYTIDRQEGNRFSGAATGGSFTETLIGAINPDGQRGIILDSDGQYDFTMQDANTLNACYHHNWPTTRVVECWQIKRAGR